MFGLDISGQDRTNISVRPVIVTAPEAERSIHYVQPQTLSRAVLIEFEKPWQLSPDVAPAKIEMTKRT